MRYNGYLRGTVNNTYVCKIKGPRDMLYSIVQSTISMRSMLLLGGSGGMPPGNFLLL